jgi:lysophospholipase
VSSDPERCRLHHDWYAVDPELRLDGPTFGWVDAALSLTGRIGKAEFLAGIGTPILLGSAEREAIVSSAAHHRAARLLPDCTLVTIPGSKHEPFLEHDSIRDAWLDRVERFITERCGATRAVQYQAADS